MKNLIIVLLLMLFAGDLFANTNQGHYRWRKDDGNAATATTISDDTGTWCQKNTNIRLRVELYCILNEGSVNLNYRLYYSTSSDPASGTWTKVTSSSSIFQMSASPNYTEGDDNTDRLGSTTKEFEIGRLLDVSDNVDLPMNAQKSGQIEFCIKATSSAVAGETYYFKITTYNESDSDIDGYDRLPSITVLETPTTQTSSIQVVSNGNGDQLDISWTNGDGSSRAVFVKEESGAITNPSDNTTYSASSDWSSKGDQLGTSGYYCVYNGTGTSVSLTNTSSNTLYTIHAFEYNGYPGVERYYTATASGNPYAESSLPVELLSFSANVVDKNVHLAWQTVTELNNYGFEIERSLSDSKNSDFPKIWEKLGFVEGAGNSYSQKDYSFADQLLSNGNYLYRLKQIDNDGKYSYSDNIEVNFSAAVPSEFSLAQNYPNPFNPTTTIKFELPEKSHVVLELFDMLGQKVMTMVNSEMEAGYHDYKLDASNLASGTYIYKLVSAKQTIAKKLILMK